MKTRTTKPESTNKYYLQKSTGYNPCILGNRRYLKAIAPKSVLPNCVGYVAGRAGEVSGEKKCALWDTNAELYWPTAKKKGYETGQSPRPGSVMVWEGIGGAAGHAAFVEKVVSSKEVITSESGWNYKNSYVLKYTRKIGDNGNWGLSMTKYKFLGFIYLPYINPYPNPKSTAVKYGMSGDEVAWVQWAINRAGVSLKIDKKFGPATQKALKTAQKKWGLSADGIAGPKTQNKIKSLYTIE